MNSTPEAHKTTTETAVEKIAKFNRELFGAEIVIIDETGSVPHEMRNETLDQSKE